MFASRLPGTFLGILFRTAGWAWLVCGVLLRADLLAGDTAAYLGPCALVASPDARTLYVANADARQVAWVELPAGTVTRRLDVPAEPTGLALSLDGTRLWVTCAAPKGAVVVIETASGQVRATISAGHTAMAPVLAPDEKRLYVCNRFDNDVSILDLAAGREVGRIKMVREPIAAAITPDGKTLLVANHLSLTPTNAFFPAPEPPVVTLVDIASGETSAIAMPFGSNGARGLCVSPDGRYAYVTHIVSNFERLPSQLDLGWTNLNVVSVMDIQRRKLVNTVGLDEIYLGAGNPWGVACSADGKSICIAQAGTHELSVIDAAASIDTLSQMFMSGVVGALPEYPPRQPALRRRIALSGKGPRALAVVGDKVYLAEYFSDTLAVVDLKADGGRQVATIALGPTPQLTARRRGELLFNDATICYQQWLSCASCHPDARVDAMTWDLMNDGIGNSKNTKSMLLAHVTPPAMSEGVRSTAEDAVRSGLKSILFADRPEAEAAAIDEYLRGLEPVPSPRLVDGRLSPAAERGKTLFESEDVGCSRCHPGPHYTDLRAHDVGTRNTYDYTDFFDTPTLVEVWRTAPYLHDGRYTTMRDLIVCGRHGDNGYLAEMSEPEIDDLVEYVLSL